ncbi:MBOAT family O-acyltransferase [Oleispirillum naphthae]|uniref:MBOAT family O-acyltransferase n=1 Tax=Oleispirillum naphthae TaxID=2838853 RepID=UPI00308268AE
MVYSTCTFALFFIAVAAWFFALRDARAQRGLLIFASAYFLSFTDLGSLAVAAAVLLCAGLALRANRSAVLRTPVLAAIVTALVCNLMFFKFRSYLPDFEAAWLPDALRTKWLIPLGISFYTFQVIGALIDAHGRADTVGATRLGLFVGFFPHLIAGPICKIRMLLPQFDGVKRPQLRSLAIGTNLFAIGFAKKILVADPLGTAFADVWADPSPHSSVAIFCAALAFYLQVYADFSGYTDMGRGIARILGFRLPVNFRGPYLSFSPLEFWQRWHISLTDWFRNYLYHPAALMLARRLRTHLWRRIALGGLVLAIMSVIGLWHGAAPRFVLFGAVQGVLILLWQMAARGRAPRGVWRRAACVAVFQTVLCLSYLVFRAETPAATLSMLHSLFTLAAGQGVSAEALSVLGFGFAAVFACQAVEFTATRRAVSRVLCGIRRSCAVWGITLAVLACGMGYKTVILDQEIRLPGHAAVEKGNLNKFIYFDF